MSSDVVLIDEPAPHVRRLTLNRPAKRNALNHALRGGIVRALREADQDPDVRVMIVRGAGKCFSSGYDLGSGNDGQEHPWYTPGGDGHWPRHVTQGWMGIWELARRSIWRSCWLAVIRIYHAKHSPPSAKNRRFGCGDA